jgi:hypothetical protein
MVDSRKPTRRGGRQPAADRSDATSHQPQSLQVAPRGTPISSLPVGVVIPLGRIQSGSAPRSRLNIIRASNSPAALTAGAAIISPTRANNSAARLSYGVPASIVRPDEQVPVPEPWDNGNYGRIESPPDPPISYHPRSRHDIPVEEIGDNNVEVMMFDGPAKSRDNIVQDPMLEEFSTWQQHSIEAEKSTERVPATFEEVDHDLVDRLGLNIAPNINIDARNIRIDSRIATVCPPVSRLNDNTNKNASKSLSRGNSIPRLAS